MNKTLDSSGPYTIMVNDGNEDKSVYDGEDYRTYGPYDSYSEAKETAEDYVRANKESWVMVLDKNETQVLAHVPWSRKPNKWN